jgi:hypothetical protein
LSGRFLRLNFCFDTHEFCLLADAFIMMVFYLVI